MIELEIDLALGRQYVMIWKKNTFENAIVYICILLTLHLAIDNTYFHWECEKRSWF